MPLHDLNWDELLIYIEDGSVVPVVGNELALSADGSNGKTLSDEIIETVARQLELEEPHPRSLPELVQTCLRDPERRNSLKFELRRAWAGVSRVPPAFEQLASIDDFRLYISATPSTMLADAVSRGRLEGETCRHILFSSPFTNRLEDLPRENLRELAEPYVFYPFGNVPRGAFAVSEEETLEYSFHLFQRLAGNDPKKRKLRNLLTALQQSHLLFIGCNFPDWLTRFWFRALAGGRLYQNPREHFEYIAEQSAHRDEPLAMFLDRIDSRLLAMDASDFVQELHRRWQERRRQKKERKAVRSSGPAPRDPYIFISYAKEDRDRAALLNQKMVESELATWFDVDHLKLGNHLDYELRRGVYGCKLFMPILSKHVRRPVGHFRREWGYAKDCLEGHAEGHPFLVPVIVDDSPHVALAEHLPREFRPILPETVPEGAATAEFCQRLHELIRKAQW